MADPKEVWVLVSDGLALDVSISEVAVREHCHLPSEHCVRYVLPEPMQRFTAPKK